MHKSQQARLGRPIRVEGEKHTKDKILEAAIELFSRQGYEKTSVRQIAGAVGLTESAVYRHYAGKEAILDAVFAFAEDFIYTPLPIERNEGEYAGQSIFRGLLLPLPGIIKAAPVIVKISRIMYAEMHHNDRVYDYFRKVYGDKAVDYLEVLFTKQIRMGKIRPCDPRALAHVFHAFRTDWAVRNFILGDAQPIDEKKLKKELEASIAFFEQFLVPEKKTSGE